MRHRVAAIVVGVAVGASLLAGTVTGEAQESAESLFEIESPTVEPSALPTESISLEIDVPGSTQE